MYNKEKFKFKTDIDTAIENCEDRIEEIIEEIIYESFPMTKVEVAYKGSLKLLIIRIRYFCYGEGQELNIRYIDLAAEKVVRHGFFDDLIYDIGDKITQKEAEYAAKRRSTGSN